MCRGVARGGPGKVGVVLPERVLDRPSGGRHYSLTGAGARSTGAHQLSGIWRRSRECEVRSRRCVDVSGLGSVPCGSLTLQEKKEA